MPTLTSIHISAYIGLNLPLILIETFGAAMMTTFAAKPDWAAAYDSNGLGGLLGAPLESLGGFGKFLLVLLALSIVAKYVALQLQLR